jgi:hypothetical protein
MARYFDKIQCLLGLHKFVKTVVPLYTFPFNPQMLIDKKSDEEMKLFLKTVKPSRYTSYTYCKNCRKPDHFLLKNLAKSLLR